MGQEQPGSGRSSSRSIDNASGVKIDPVVKQAYDEMYGKKLYSYLIFRVAEDEKSIVVEKKGDKGAPYTEFLEELKQSIEGGKECRYGCVDVEFNIQRQGTGTASSLQKVIFVQMCPDDAPVRKRMIYASSVRDLKAALGLERLMQIQASEISDLDEKAIKSELMSQQRM